jgi:hypothetical protein
MPAPSYLALMETPDNVVFCEIGRAASAWAQIESLLTFGIGHFSGIPMDKAECMFASSGAYEKIQSFHCLLGDACNADEEFCRDMADLLERIDEARIQRNQFQHCEVIIEQNSVTFSDKKRVKNSDRIKIRTNCYSLDGVKEIASGISDLADELRSFLERAAELTAQQD